MTVAESKVDRATSQMGKVLASGELITMLRSQGFELSKINGSISAVGSASAKDTVKVIDPRTGAIVKDNEAPLLILRGNATLELVLSADGVQFKDPGASAIDQIDGDLSTLVYSKLLNGTDMDLSSPTLPREPYIIRFAPALYCFT
jgi:hypothetical protein